MNAQFRNVTITHEDAQLLPELSAEHREILVALPRSYAELATHLKVPVGTVRSRLHRARAALVKLREQRLAA